MLPHGAPSMGPTSYASGESLDLEIAMRASLWPSYAFENKLLQTLPADVLLALRPSLTSVRMVTGQILIERGEAPEHVYFLEDGIVALVADTGNSGAGVQVAMIGREGMVGGLALLGADSLSFARSVCLIPGAALRISVVKLQALLEQHASLRDVCTSHVASLIRQTMQNAACNAGNTLAERCARWLLMAHERVDGDEVRVTHEALAMMLGVRRAGVTVVAASLQLANLIKVNRGRITILDRAGLARISRDPTLNMEFGPGVGSPQSGSVAPERFVKTIPAHGSAPGQQHNRVLAA